MERRTYKHDRGKNDEQSILHTRRNKINIAFETSHGKDIDDIICHYVGYGEHLNVNEKASKPEIMAPETYLPSSAATSGR